MRLVIWHERFSMREKIIFLCAGGTGGHLFPALALASALQKKSVSITLLTDARAKRYIDEQMHTILLPAATPTRKGIFAKLFAYGVLAYALVRALILLALKRPSVVVGFGGYPTVAPVVAAGLLGIPVVLHEQNAALGRANKFLLPYATKLATGFADVYGLSAHYAARQILTGNPLRPAVLQAARAPYVWCKDGVLHIVVTGGSQGASSFSKLMPEALQLFSIEERKNIRVTHQCRKGDEDTLREAYQALGIAAEVAPFFTDLPQRLAIADAVLARSGASTVSELSALGRPSLLIPYPHALDQDQACNAQVLVDAGAAEMVRETELTPQRLLDFITRAMRDNAAMQIMSDAARGVAHLDAAERLADVVMGLVK